LNFAAAARSCSAPRAESVPGLVAVNWWGAFMPAGTPKAITDKFTLIWST